MKQEKDKGFYIITHSGKRIYFNDLENNHYDIEDIAHSLSINNRFNGHTYKPYSVAQHSVIMANIMKERGFSPQKQMKALLHDCSEAYMPDLPTPFKKQPEFEGFVRLENRLQDIIYLRFGCPPGKDHDVKYLDTQMLATEIRDLMGNLNSNILPEVDRIPEKIIPWGYDIAEKAFLNSYKMLSKQILK